MNRFFATTVLCLTALTAAAVDWNTIENSGEYYYGQGVGASQDEASASALNNLLQSISVSVSSDFSKIYDGVTTPDAQEFTKTVRLCIQTYTSSSLNNVETMFKQQKGQWTVLKFMRKSELEKIYQERINRLKAMAKQADKALERGDVAVALQYYYWSYALLRSLQHPNTVKDDAGEVMVNAIPLKINDIIDDIDVKFLSRDDDFIDLSFTYQGQPTTVDFTYYDGRKEGCEGNAEGGLACIEMADGHADDGAFHINIEYEYKSQARGDAEMKSVLAVIPCPAFGDEIVVRAPKANAAAGQSSVAGQSGRAAGAGSSDLADAASFERVITPAAPTTNPHAAHPENQAAPGKKVPTAEVAKAFATERMLAQAPLYSAVLDTVLQALATRQYETALNCFVGRGQDNFRRLVTRRNGRLVGNPIPRLYVNARGLVMARGVQLSFSVTERGQKTTYVDDVIFTFNEQRKIENLTFGIGSLAEEQLLEKDVTFGEDVRQQVLDFLENYKTAYCLKDSDYIKAVFDENATIIVGHVAKVTTRPGMDASEMSQLGRDIITYKQYTKAEYLANLQKTFQRNQFINIKFTDNDIQMVGEGDEKIFAIQIAQQYNSSTYADFGYLFLLVDMTHADEPLIKIRTWQPKPDEEFGLWGPGHFYE